MSRFTAAALAAQIERDPALLDRLRPYAVDRDTFRAAFLTAGEPWGWRSRPAGIVIDRPARDADADSALDPGRADHIGWWDLPGLVAGWASDGRYWLIPHDAGIITSE